MFLCFEGFVQNTPVDAVITDPGGSLIVGPGGSTTFRVDTYSTDGVPNLERLLLPGDPLGSYEVTATQGSLEVMGTFEVSLPASPRVLLLPPGEGRAGTTFRLAMAGYSPGRSVALYLYREGDAGSYGFVATLPSAEMDRDGTTTYSVATEHGDPPDAYCIVEPVGLEAPDTFCSAIFVVTV